MLLINASLSVTDTAVTAPDLNIEYDKSLLNILKVKGYWGKMIAILC